MELTPEEIWWLQWHITKEATPAQLRYMRRKKELRERAERQLKLDLAEILNDGYGGDD